MIDLAIIGGGPAALTAAIYAARAGLQTQVFEKSDFGGVLPVIPLVENYPGFMGEGKELALKMRQQAQTMSASLVYGECTRLDLSASQPASGFTLTIDDTRVTARTVLVASGSEPKKLGFDLAIPVSYCALCDGAFAKDKNAVVVGGANSALQEALYLANLAKKVTIITHSQLKADQELIDRARQVSNITIVENVEPTRAYLEAFDYCFVYIGKTPATHFLDSTLLDPHGYIVTGKASSATNNRKQFNYQTKIPGLFAAGDVRQGSTKQIVTAAGEGAAAAIEILDFLSVKH